MKFTFALNMALLGFAMLVLCIYSTTNAINIGSIKYVAFFIGVIFFPAGIQLVRRNLNTSRLKNQPPHS